MSKKYAGLLLTTLLLWSTSCSAAEESVIATETGTSSSENSQQAQESTGTLTLSTGETFELDVRQCDTQTTTPTSSLTDEFFDVVGVTPDGIYRFKAQFRNVHDTPDRYGPQVVLAGLHDEDGVNPEIKYHNLSTRYEMPIVAVDANRVTGEAELHRQESDERWGDQVNAVFAFNCA